MISQVVWALIGAFALWAAVMLTIDVAIKRAAR